MVIAMVQFFVGLCSTVIMAGAVLAMESAKRCTWFDVVAGLFVPPYLWVLSAMFLCQRVRWPSWTHGLVGIAAVITNLMCIAAGLGLGSVYIVLRWFSALLWFAVPVTLLFGKLAAVKRQ
jgi:hypothetical protein